MNSRRSEAWNRLMEARGLTSYRRIADVAEISHEAVRRVVLGMSSDEESVEAVARALRVDVELVREMRGEPATDPGRWSPPPASRLLTDDERAALSRLIGVMVAGRGREDGEGDDQLGAPSIDGVKKGLRNPTVTLGNKIQPHAEEQHPEHPRSPAD